jgi:hypothetical protein
MMKQLFAGIFALALLPLVSPLLPAQAQTTAAATRTAGPFSYDISKEVTLNGTVLSVLANPSQGMVGGAHLLLATPFGPVDIGLGIFGLRGKGALSVAPGQQIEVTGVMKTLKENQVFLARLVKAGNRIYAIRNEHGIAVSPQARERASHKAAQTGETL